MDKQLDTQLSFVYSEQAAKVLEIAKENGWHVRIVGTAPMPTAPFFQGKWWYEPVTKDQVTVGLDRLYKLQKAGVTWQGLVIGHEVHFVEVKQPSEPKPTPSRDFKNIDILPALGAVAGVVATGLVLGLGALALGILRVALIDPALIIITSDNVWCEIVTWVE